MLKKSEAKIILFFVAVTSLASALPQPTGAEKVPTSGYSDNPPSIDLPFIQFKDGGIHLNFAGYHAAAGLGGLLGGSDAKGGLYASAGTPWGPSASAGLGGSLGGRDGTARGGLHARAGVGNGGPEAAAGLGGNLDGSGRSGSRARGGLYAGATAGGPQAGAGLGGAIDESGVRSSSSYATSSSGRKTKISVKNTSNVQAIEPRTRAETLPEATSAAPSVNLVTRDVPDAGAKDDISGPNRLDPASKEFSSPARRYFRKKLRSSPIRKQAHYKTFSTSTIDDIPAAGSVNHPSGIVERQAQEARASDYTPPPYGGATKQKSTTLFDDIFNIPISVLNAVNQLLNNKAG